MCLVLAASMATTEKDWDLLGKSWWSHVQFLADDKLEGRGTGTEGFAKAASYVIDQFEKVRSTLGNGVERFPLI